MFNSATNSSISPKLKPNTGFKYFCAGLFLVGLLALRLGSSQTANLSYGVLAGYALFGRKQVVHALTISWLFTLINPALAPDGSVGSFGRYLVIATAAVSMFLRGNVIRDYKIGRLQAFTGILGGVLVLHSLAFSPVVDVSVLKAISWTVAVITLMSAWKGLALDDRKKLERQIELGFVGIMLVSLPLLLLPSVGYLRNGTGFQGVLNHPQAFGPTVALAGVIFSSRILASSTHRWRDILAVFLSIFLIVLSEARTAGFAFVFGTLGAAIIVQAFSSQRRGKILEGLRSYKLRFVIVVVAVLTLIAAPMLHEALTKYLFKRSDADSILAAADASRGQLVDKMISNISEHPLSGIGFGISSDLGAMTVERDPVFNLPLSAVIEKGVLPLAVMEELGFFGAVAVFAWFSYLVVRGARSGIEKLAVLLTILLANMGESMLFSVGGMGMIFLILLAQVATNTSQGKSERA